LFVSQPILDESDIRVDRQIGSEHLDVQVEGRVARAKLVCALMKPFFVARNQDEIVSLACE